MTTQSDAWRSIADQLKVRIVAPFIYSCGGREVEFAAMLPDFGGESGIVVDPDWGRIEPAIDDLKRDGFGFSCIEVDDDSEDMIEILEDWTWTGSGPSPSWCSSN